MSEAKPLALVVDDEVQIRRFLRAGLELDGFAVEEAESGIQALRCATLQPPATRSWRLSCARPSSSLRRRQRMRSSDGG